MAVEEEKKKKSRLDALRERNTAKYPDETFADDEAHLGRYMDDYDALEAENGKYKTDLEEANKKNKAIDDLFSRDPQSARFMMNWASGKDPLVELYRRYGEDAAEVLKDPDKMEEFAKEREEELKRIADENTNVEETMGKLTASLDALDELSNSGKYKQEDVDRALDKLSELAHKYYSGEFGEEEIIGMLKLLDHDKNVEEAGMAGEVKGKNAQMKERLRKPTKGDGLPDLDGGGNLPSNDVDAPDLGALNRFSGEPDIFARGGEKRTVRR